tara:strand:- start:1532 stop:1654 length:123 start_codon:yes stop_codon:yes gene_type:complete
MFSAATFAATFGVVGNIVLPSKLDTAVVAIPLPQKDLPIQ